MSQAAEQAAELARRLALVLEHYRDVWDLQYVPASSGVESSVAAVPVERTAAPAADQAAAAAVADGCAPSAHVPAARPEATQPPVTKRAALRAQAQQWSPATKLEYLRRRNIGDCQRCPLAKSRTNIVFGVGSPQADIMFIGEAPGADEDRRGEPFVGRAGERLDRWIEALGLRREDVYIANVLKCRPPGNRDPRPPEIDACSPFLRAQIRAIEPRVIVALGRHAGMLLSRREDLSLRAMRQARLAYDASAKNQPKGSAIIPLVVTYHPAYVLRQENERDTGSAATDAVMQDLRRAVQLAQD